ncbi:uncharacterized protein SEPMUDRAFT_147251 [Sphaerulina musiva SO2202]|uniref:Uncharacterized protein n=1 Tax=Sphaerulina musiva (strain SO2202) TaxID=692275 RepID=M3CNI1_SPHMS|nr:uncharacterized protein SEPMUDRAFT_147251 [Sphaerulina musiva SO2202]EMF15338.1 hypothetical protein SEPMUDRAFT_147251 [Sphaerulina musiva SO2202]
MRACPLITEERTSHRCPHVRLGFREMKVSLLAPGGPDFYRRTWEINDGLNLFDCPLCGLKQERRGLWALRCC